MLQHVSQSASRNHFNSPLHKIGFLPHITHWCSPVLIILLISLATADKQVQIFQWLHGLLQLQGMRPSEGRGVKGVLHIIKQEVSVAYLVKFTNCRCMKWHLYIDTDYFWHIELILIESGSCLSESSPSGDHGLQSYSFSD